MLFNSIDYILFLPVVVAAYFATPHRYRWVLLLAASYYFYMCWKAEYVFLILASTAIDYVAGIRIAAVTRQSKRRAWLTASLVSNLGILFAFKYYNFFGESMRAAFEHFNLFYHMPVFDALLPVGISFYTFQSMSYTIDVYCKKREPERHAGIFALYVSFFPQLVAGPIERSTHLIPQFYVRRQFDYDRAASGLRLILWGMFKKVVIADQLAVVVDLVYANPQDYPEVPILLATYFFAMQIYCDFSGYTDIARGSARILGYDLMENFRRPYLATSIRDFWGRWHISLSTWFRDYLYVPLGGNRVEAGRWAINVFVVFVVSGLWHGANWTFLVWGSLHGAYLLVGQWTKPMRAWFSRFPCLNRAERLHNALRILVTFHLVLLGWVFFRANSVADAEYILGALLNPVTTVKAIVDHTMETGWLTQAGLQPGAVVLMAASVPFLLIVQYAQEKHGLNAAIVAQPAWVRWLLYLAGTLAIANLGAIEEVPFIYFQF